MHAILRELYEWIPAFILLMVVGAILGLIKWKWAALKKAFAPDQPDVNPGGVTGHPGLYLLYQVITIVVYAGIVGISLRYWNNGFTPIGPNLNFGPAGVLLVIFDLTASLRQVDADETAGAFSFGMALKRLSPGLHFVPWILMSLKRNTIHFQDSQFPGEPEQIFRRDDNKPLQPGQVQPIRIATGAPKQAVNSEDPNNILDAQMTLEVSFVSRWRVTDMLNFVANYGSVEAVNKSMRDVGEATLGEDFSQKTPKEIIATLPAINTKLLTEVGKRFPHAGFEIESFRLISPDLSHGVSSALADIPMKRAKAAQVRITAAAIRDQRTELGKGTANARYEVLTAEAAGQKKIKNALNVDGALVLAAQTALPAAQNAKVIIAGGKGGMADLLGLATGAREALDATKEEKETA